MTKEEMIIDRLTRRKQTLAAAESCTGGLVVHRLTNIPGASAVLHFGLCVYNNVSKTKFLSIPEAVIREHGAVSEETALLMAQNVRRIQNSDFGIGITGIAGPDGGTKSKPVGLVFIALATKDENICLQCIFPGDRKAVKTQAASQTLELLLEFLK